MAKSRRSYSKRSAERRPSASPRESKKPPRPSADAWLTSLLAWFVTLEGTPSGRLMLTNILHAFRTQRLPEEGLRTLFDAIVVEWVSEGGQRADVLVETIADRRLAELLCYAGAQLDERCSRVVDDKTLVSHNIDFRELPFRYSDEVPRRLLEVLESGIPEGAACSELRGRRPFAWVTSTTQLDAIRRQCADGEDLASTVRDLLGLTHYSGDHLLVEIQYPDQVTAALSVAPPTFLEGGAGVIFRAKKADARWGRAVDLRTHDDGLPEAVHSPIAFTSAFRIRRIGRIVRSQGFSFEEVRTRADYPWTGMPDDLLQFMSNQGRHER